MPLSIGDSLPNITINIVGGDYAEPTEIQLSDLVGQRTVLYFYPKNNTPG